MKKRKYASKGVIACPVAANGEKYIALLKDLLPGPRTSTFPRMPVTSDIPSAVEEKRLDPQRLRKEDLLKLQRDKLFREVLPSMTLHVFPLVCIKIISYWLLTQFDPSPTPSSCVYFSIYCACCVNIFSTKCKLCCTCGCRVFLFIYLSIYFCVPFIIQCKSQQWFPSPQSFLLKEFT